MLLFDGFGGLLMLGLWIFCFIDVLLTPESGCRNLPKLAWVFLVILLPPIGPIAWLVAGRQWNRTATPQRPGSRVGATAGSTRSVPTNPDDDEEFLAGLRQRAEEQRRRARDKQEPDRPDGGDTA